MSIILRCDFRCGITVTSSGVEKYPGRCCPSQALPISLRTY